MWKTFDVGLLLSFSSAHHHMMTQQHMQQASKNQIEQQCNKTSASSHASSHIVLQVATPKTGCATKTEQQHVNNRGDTDL